MNMLEVVKPKYGKVPQHSRTDTEPIDPALGIVDITRVMLIEKIYKGAAKAKYFLLRYGNQNQMLNKLIG